MSFMTWENGYSVHIASLDDQHRRLFNLVNQMSDAVKEAKDAQVLGNVLKEMQDYTEYHFASEQELFDKYRYPDRNKHRKAHESLTEMVKAFKAEFESGKNVSSIMVMNFLKKWWSKHILSVDKNYVAFLTKNGVS